MSDFAARLQAFVALLEKERNEALLERHPTLDAAAKREGRRGYEECGFDTGKKFVRVWGDKGLGASDHQKSVDYFVMLDTEEIYGADGWKKPNFKRRYGTLSTIEEWSWGGFYAVSKKGLDTLVPKGQRYDDKGKDGVSRAIRQAVNDASRGRL